MHASIRRYRVRDIDTLVSKVESEFVDQVKEIDGFVGYYVIDGGDGTAASVTVGETAEAVAESTRRAGNWVRDSAADLVDGQPEVTVGEVRVRAEREAEQRAGLDGPRRRVSGHRLEIVLEPRLRLHAVEPPSDAVVAPRLRARVLRAVHVGVESYVGDRVPAGHELAPVAQAAVQRGQRVVSALETVLVDLGQLLVAARQPQEAGVAQLRLDAVLLEEQPFEHAGAREAGIRRYGVPSARWARIAFDSTMCSPESSSSTGTRPSRLRAKCSGVRVSPLKRSTVTRSNGSSSWRSRIRAFMQFPDAGWSYRITRAT